MYDDGNHEDGAANDGVYGASLVAYQTDIQYFIYAENSDAAAFLPLRAEYEFFSISVSGSLVINEFMADNETTVSDQDGDFDDWIELFNNSDEDISLSGYFLSDDPTEPDLWMFPDTTILAGGYLIIWADKDEDQMGLHADLKLSASGESILLSDPELNLIDEVDFGEQTIDISYGRFPNGTGDFDFMSPTFNMENISGITGIEYPEPEIASSINAYPNPFNNQFHIDFQLKESAQVEVVLYDVYGRSVGLESSDFFYEGNQSITIETAQLNTGVWICKMFIGEEEHTIKLMKY
jgi:hypothetical protein